MIQGSRFAIDVTSSCTVTLGRCVIQLRVETGIHMNVSSLSSRTAAKVENNCIISIVHIKDIKS